MFSSSSRLQSLSIRTLTIFSSWSLLLPLVASSPQTEPPTIAPTVQSLNMFGPGCPIGAGGIVQQIRNDTPVFLFTEWGLALPDVDDNTKDTVSKWCTEEISLANGPVGMQVRIATVTVSGWATLDLDTKLGLEVETQLGDAIAGNQSAIVGHGDLKENKFEVALATQPEDIWSACVGDSGDVPKIVIRTSLSMAGGKLADGQRSGGVVGGAKTDLKKALSVHFQPVWRPCSGSGHMWE
ncbi:hypothetical protein B0T19DRAFT_442675 [Cercophora scortea]|uniref:Uncharacterized protein n=1 Tax=Cercophora scortea TaxID=314031 RepID=A0AAE0M8G2_9PEZI|nr:hypothetical protein B0T19DRAFT_442675 [Cercophora scortea]